MRVVELARMVLDLPAHHLIAAEVDGFECPIVDTGSDGHGEASVVCVPPDGYRLLPPEPTEAMLDACGHMGMTPAAMRVMWATMILAHDKENE